jgi:hypothetical protein
MAEGVSKLISISPERTKERMYHCDACEYKKTYTQGLFKRNYCEKRDCKCSLLGKALWAASTCPEGKWKV